MPPTMPMADWGLGLGSSSTVASPEAAHSGGISSPILSGSGSGGAGGGGGGGSGSGCTSYGSIYGSSYGSSGGGSALGGESSNARAEILMVRGGAKLTIYHQ